MKVTSELLDYVKVCQQTLLMQCDPTNVIHYVYSSNKNRISIAAYEFDIWSTMQYMGNI